MCEQGTKSIDAETVGFYNYDNQLGIASFPAFMKYFLMVAYALTSLELGIGGGHSQDNVVDGAVGELLATAIAVVVADIRLLIAERPAVHWNKS